jgi:hypothetical protein
VLTFDASSHTYTLAGRTLISVTQALQESGLVNTSFYTDEHALRGTLVHRTLQYLDDDDLVESSVPPQLEGYVQAYRAFLRENDPGPILVNEQQFCDPVLGFAGTIDRIRVINGAVTILDIKTGFPCAWHGLQLAAYQQLARLHGFTATKRVGLYLKPYGAYTVTPYTDRSDWDVFRAALLIAQFQRRYA